MAGRYSPIDPVALTAVFPAPNLCGHDDPVLSAIVGNNADLLAAVARLWIKPDDIVVDATWGRGAMWNKLDGMPTHAHDIAKDGVDCRALPYKANTIDVLVLDPPYRPTHGSKNFAGNGLAEAYALGGSSLDTIEDVLQLYRAAIVEAARVLKSGGRILVKCQDISYGHRLHLVSLDILRLLIENGFDFADQFILVNETRLRSGAWNKQERARRAHSVLWVGVKQQLSK